VVATKSALFIAQHASLNAAAIRYVHCFTLRRLRTAFACQRLTRLPTKTYAEEGLRQKFRTAKPEIGEAPAQYIARLESYLMRWIDLADVEL